MKIKIPMVLLAFLFTAVKPVTAVTLTYSDTAPASEGIIKSNVVTTGTTSGVVAY